MRLRLRVELAEAIRDVPFDIVRNLTDPLHILPVRVVQRPVPNVHGLGIESPCAEEMAILETFVR